ncbi:hypothetical protein CAEBREN_14127 [Caenorhabditis brenneri]|uniref:DUF7154 domain-containing protein n=1 Tax=Caenorhabditis brenneri TaxID=135651 RepID=G0NDL0_CAEBE|nr:hypothetical protein CAEBREN_14127 [Caenorhabditis brenneri]
MTHIRAPKNSNFFQNSFQKSLDFIVSAPPALCAPMKNSTFFFAYSNDLDNSTVLGALREAVAFNMWGLPNRYKFTANIRLDTKTEEEIQYHNDNPFFFNTSVLSLLPDPALGYGDSTTGSNVFSFIQKFLSNKQIPICGSALFIMMKRYPSQTDISPLIAQLRANNVYVYFIAPEVPSGGNSPHLLYEMSSKTNGFCTFVNDKNYTAVVEESIEFMERPFQFMSKKYVVSGSGRLEIPSFITPIPFFVGDAVMAQLTVQDHVVDNNFISLNYTITGVQDGSVAHKFPRDDYFGRRGSGIVDEMILNGTTSYKLTLDYKYASNQQQVIELRMYNQYYHDFPPLSG